MVELCELNILDQGLECQWPSDIDQHIAQLNFERSTDGENSLFSSMVLDPSMISTDSLDMDKLHAKCEVNKDDFKIAFDDSGQWNSGNFTTWGRIKSTEPLDEKTNSLPEIGTATRPACSVKRPSSLLATFVERQPDYEYSELYIGDGRYVDVNDNEIGFVPQSTASLQSADRWRNATKMFNNPPLKPRRTFADFQSRVPPQLDFMVMQHQMPSLCQSSLSLSEIMVKMKDGEMGEDDKLDMSVLNVLEDHGPDSGLGSSESASSGPSHIEDWSSLAILLPKHVVEACSFFKANSRLLTGSNNIERCVPRKSEACRTCFGIRKRLHPPAWAQPANARRVLCDCTSSEIIERNCCSARERSFMSDRFKLHALELSIVGFPIYDAKRVLVEKVVEGVAEVARGSNASSLCAAMETLIGDGLQVEHSWHMICAITAPGPATRAVYNIVKALNNSDKSLKCRVAIFFNELLRSRSMDCWICYAVLKESVLRKFYSDGAFMMRACTSYRSLFWRLVENLELLAVIDKSTCMEAVSSEITTGRIEACPIARDSRVPKSSSVPARLSNSPQRSFPSPQHTSHHTNQIMVMKKSRIPVLNRRPKRSSSAVVASSKSSSTSLASVVRDLDEPGMLVVSRGERIKILANRGTLAHCCRMRPRRHHVLQGLIPKSNLHSLT